MASATRSPSPGRSSIGRIHNPTWLDPSESKGRISPPRRIGQGSITCALRSDRPTHPGSHFAARYHLDACYPRLVNGCENVGWGGRIPAPPTSPSRKAPSRVVIEPRDGGPTAEIHPDRPGPTAPSQMMGRPAVVCLWIVRGLAKETADDYPDSIRRCRMLLDLAVLSGPAYAEESTAEGVGVISGDLTNGLHGRSP